MAETWTSRDLVGKGTRVELNKASLVRSDLKS